MWRGHSVEVLKCHRCGAKVLEGWVEFLITDGKLESPVDPFIHCDSCTFGNRGTEWIYSTLHMMRLRDFEERYGVERKI